MVGRDEKAGERSGVGSGPGERPAPSSDSTTPADPAPTDAGAGAGGAHRLSPVAWRRRAASVAGARRGAA